MNIDIVKIGEIRDLMTSSGVQKVEIIDISINRRITVVDWKSTTSSDFGRTIESAFYEPIPESAWLKGDKKSKSQK